MKKLSPVIVIGIILGTFAFLPRGTFAETFVGTVLTATIISDSTPIAYVPASGGTLEFTTSDNISTTSAVVAIPANSYNGVITISAFNVDSAFVPDIEPPNAGDAIVGIVLDFNLLNSSGDTVHSLSKLTTITLTYSDSDIVGLNEQSLRPYRWDTGDTEWHLMHGSILDTNTNTITFFTNTFSTFALFASPPEPPAPPVQSPATGSGASGFTSGTSFYYLMHPISYIEGILYPVEQATSSVYGNTLSPHISHRSKKIKVQILASRAVDSTVNNKQTIVEKPLSIVASSSPVINCSQSASPLLDTSTCPRGLSSTLLIMAMIVIVIISIIVILVIR